MPGTKNCSQCRRAIPTADTTCKYCGHIEWANLIVATVLTLASLSVGIFWSEMLLWKTIFIGVGALLFLVLCMGFWEILTLKKRMALAQAGMGDCPDAPDPKESRPATKQARPSTSAGSSGVDNLAALLNNLDNQGAEQFAQFLNQAAPADVDKLAGELNAPAPDEDPSVRGAANLGLLLRKLGEGGGAEGLAAALNTLGETGAQQMGHGLRTASEGDVNQLAENLLAKSGVTRPPAHSNAPDEQPGKGKDVAHQPPRVPQPGHIIFACSSCHAKLRSRPELAGKRVKCAKCGQAVAVPKQTAAAPKPIHQVAKAAAPAEAPAGADPAVRAEVERLIATITAPCDGRSRGDPIEVAQRRLRAIGQAAVPTLLAALPLHREWPLIYLVKSLTEIGDRRAIDPLFSLTTIDDESVQEAVLDALVTFGDTRAFDGLVRLALHGTVPYRRAPAIKGLGKLGDARAVDSLLVVLRDQNPYLRSDAAEALGQIGDPRAQASLTEAALHDPEGRVQKAAREALQRLGPAAAQEWQKQATAMRVPLNPDGRALYDLLHSGRTFTSDNPIVLDAPDAVVYLGRDGRSSERWFLCLPTGSRVRAKREITIDPDKNPDRFVVEAIKAAPSWRIAASADGCLYRLIQAGWLLDYQNPIIIGDIAYVYHDVSMKEWELRVPISREAEKSFKLSRITPIQPDMDKAVLETIAAVGIHLAWQR